VSCNVTLNSEEREHIGTVNSLINPLALRKLMTISFVVQLLVTLAVGLSLASDRDD